MLITRDESQGLVEGRLHVDADLTGKTKPADGARVYGNWLDARYGTELGRRRDHREPRMKLS